MAYAEVIGDPIGHSKSPTIHRFWLQKSGLEGDYRAAHVRAADLSAYFDARNADPEWRGCNVTIPHKQAVIPFLSRLDPMAVEVGAVNLISPEENGLVGSNSDVAGIIDALGPVDLNGATACLIGSGGAALAAIAAFRRIGVTRLLINVRDPAKGEMLLDRSGLDGAVGPVSEHEHLRSADLIVNASILGMAGQPAMPQDLLDTIAEGAKQHAIVLDMVYSPLDTGLLQAVRSRGCVAVDGLAMLIGQAGSAFETFFAAKAPRDHDNALRTLLTS